jgi:mono/diheme cytochrome c family protein
MRVELISARFQTPSLWTRYVAIAVMCWGAVVTGAIASGASASQPPDSASAQKASSIWSGIYSAEQAKRGEASAAKNCTKCHNPGLEGGQDGPSLVGPEVMGAWSGQSVGNLFDRIKSTMPADAPLTLGAAEVADIVAYVLSLNKCPAGDKDLTPDMTVLNRIQISARP